MPRSPHVLLVLALLLAAGCTTPRPAAQPSAPAARPHFDLPDLERRVLREVNVVRDRHGHARLDADTALAALGRAHSDAMQRRGFFAHADPEGRRAADRARRASYPFRALGENLYRGRLYDTVTRSRIGDRTTTSTLWHTPDALAALVVQMWMESPGHRDNMLSTSFDYGGVGIAVGAGDEVFVTLNLSAR
ncbi:MAG: CAP domain-containing protein [Rhodothermales bacterium]